MRKCADWVNLKFVYTRQRILTILRIINMAAQSALEKTMIMFTDREVWCRQSWYVCSQYTVLRLGLGWLRGQVYLYAGRFQTQKYVNILFTVLYCVLLFVSMLLIGLMYDEGQVYNPIVFSTVPSVDTRAGELGYDNNSNWDSVNISHTVAIQTCCVCRLVVLLRRVHL